ncbi:MULTISPECIES: response regulator transcription factor [unclassified Romboutsia]|uniref:response regulator transcription factor n=1 Tax=unclassified Romboutsia TaxID=2626894 RepID=UPI000822AB07|nr:MULTISPECIES: response regulator transcription factor [unclassified Romboutsia]SCI14385.1 Alkaline phosphatase synthesis transcriptional regulatory protein phoP [uncultured Clostridium sp.]
MSYNILVVEDDIDIIKLLKIYLENDGYNVYSANNGIEALKIVENIKIDLVVMDIMMPKMDGYELTKRVREKYNVPIIILSAKNEDSDKILGLNLGADDYITKPFNPLEIVARVNSNLRRFYHLNNPSKYSDESSKLVVGDLVLDRQKLALFKRGQEITVTPTEYKILLLLMKTPGRVYTKVQIYEDINGEYFSNDDNTMMVHISRLREKVEDDSKNPEYIKTVRGIGYKIEDK